MLSVSAVIPTYNGTQYLVEAVKSALAQTYGLLEIIVVDDGSREPIEALVSPFFPRVTYVRQDNAGPAAARNHGISLARGDVIALLDDDDVWHPTKTAEQVKFLAENPRCALVYSYPELIDENGKVIPNEPPAEFPSGDVCLAFLARNRITSPSVTLIRREVFETIGLFDEDRECISCEDYEMWLRIAKHYEVLFCPGTLTSYRLRNAGISRNLDKHLKANLYLYDKLASEHAETPKLSDREFHGALDENRHRLLKFFAYNYYYRMEDRAKARSLLLDALRIHPYCLKDILYVAVFSMPEPLFRFMRRIKQRF